MGGAIFRILVWLVMMAGGGVLGLFLARRWAPLLPPEALFMLAMVKLAEEPEAIAKFGEAYRECQQSVPMFNLRADCLRLLLGAPEL